MTGQLGVSMLSLFMLAAIPVVSSFRSEARRKDRSLKNEPEQEGRGEERRGEDFASEVTGAARFEKTPFAHVLLIVTRIHADKVPIIQAAYRPHFWDTLYVGPHASSNETSHLQSQGFGVVDDCSDYQALDRGWLDVTYPCVGRLLFRLSALARSSTTPTNALESRLQAQRRETPLRGVLVMQADFWVSPSSFWQGLNLDRLWRLPNNFNCTSHDRLAAKMKSPDEHRDVHWWRTQSIDFEMRDIATAALHSQSFGLDSSLVCSGWVDMYYVPQQVWLTWSQVAGIVGQRMNYPNPAVLMNEAAVPLIMDAVSKHGRCSTELVTTCWGNVSQSTQDPAVLQKYPCGHKMDLTSPQIRTSLVALWRSSGHVMELSSPHDNKGRKMDLSSRHVVKGPTSPRLPSLNFLSTDPQRTAILKSICGALAIVVAIMSLVWAGQCSMPLLVNHLASLCAMGLYIAISVTIDLLVMAQQTVDHQYKFDPLCAIILTEFVKFVISAAAYLPSLRSHGLRPMLSDVYWMCLPATCYTLNNVLVFVAMAANGAATFGIFRDTVVLWTAALWYLVYKVPMKWIRILGLSLLGVGLLINRGSAAFDTKGSKWAFLSVVLMTLCNAMGAVTNEHVLKRNADLDINAQNMLLYMICMTTSICVLALCNPSHLSSMHSFFEGFTRETVLMVALQAFAGLLISRLLKYTDAVYKSVGSCLRGPMLAVIAPLFVHSEIPSSAATLVSAIVVASGSFAYLSQGPLSAEVRTVKQDMLAGKLSMTITL